MKIASWNVNSLKVRLPQVLEYLAANPLDVLALQETKCVDEQFPHDEIREAGYHVSFCGQKTYNGVAIISKHPIENVINALPGYDDPQKRFLAADINGVHVVNVYVPNGQSVDSDKYHYKLTWLGHLHDYLASTIADNAVVVLGDFNIAPEDQDVHDPVAWEGHVLVSEPERAALQSLLDLGLQDSFRLFDQEEKSYSWWDYRQGAFRRNRGLRIDLLLLTEQCAQACQASIIDKTPRSWERPSDHTVVCVDMAL